MRLHDDIIVYRRVSESAFGLPENSLVKHIVKEDNPVNSTSKIDRKALNSLKIGFKENIKRPSLYEYEHCERCC